MLDWLKKSGGGKPVENRIGLAQKPLELLAEDFAPLDELASGISGRIIQYLVGGDGEEVLVEIAGLAHASEKLRLRCTQDSLDNDTRTPRGEFFRSVECTSAEFFRRLSRVYEAAARKKRRRLSRCLNDPKLDWLEILLIEATQLTLHMWPTRCRACPALSAELLETMLELEGLPSDLLVRAAFLPELDRFGGRELEPVFVRIRGFGKSVARHPQALLAALDHSDFMQRRYALTMMQKCKVPAKEFIEKLVELAVSSSRQVREAAEPLLNGVKAAARPLVERKAVEGTADEKVWAVELLWRLHGETRRNFLQTRLGEEKNKKVLRAIEGMMAAAPPNAAPEINPALELPVLEPVPVHAPLGRETELAWQACFQQVNAAIAKHKSGNTGKLPPDPVKPVSLDAIAKSFQQMQTGSSNEVVFKDLTYGFSSREFSAPIHEFWQRPELKLIHLVRFLLHLGSLRKDRGSDWQILCYGYWLETLLPLFRRTHPEAGLRELGAAFATAGLDARRIGLALLHNYQELQLPFGLPPAQIWPYWAGNLELLEQAFSPSSGDSMDRYDHRQARRNALHVLVTFPRPPERLVPFLWKLALGPKTERSLAQRGLEALPEKVERLISSLTAGDAETRLAAAEWLGRIRDARAVDPLLASLEKERNETTKGVMMSALELLGASVEQFLDRKALLAEAEKGLAKGVPEDLKWFPFGQLPIVHWADNGKTVDTAVLKWWLIQGCKLRNPEPGPLLRKYCASLKASEREALGQFVLESWLGEDTSPITRAEAENRALQTAQQYVQWSQSSWWPANSPKKTLEEFYADFLPGLLLQPKGSAVGSKGILSLSGACAGAGAAPTVGQYLKQWYGMRAAQCRALLQMLAWVEHKTATQLLLAVGSRFRTKGIQEEASRQARALAERKGWSVAELADRTIPTAGLDDAGVLTLDFGPRQFTVTLNEGFEFVLQDPDGKPLKSLPDTRKDDDETKAAEARKIFSAAKKELKSVVAMQRDRLYEAMCTQRTWPFEDWNIFLNRHPIARHHCQRVVWSVLRDGKTGALFRPLADGTLTDANDDPVTVNPGASIRVAHECLVTPEQSQVWRQHLKDYEVEPLFEQFGRPNFDLSEQRKQEDELNDFRGHVLEAFKLRGRANKLGYTRGQAQDGGWFFDYHKRFPTLGIEAVLEFTGNGLPEENRMVALTTLHFERAAAEGEPVNPGSKMALGEVPPVLLSECWNDIRQIAAEGPGFDPDWEKKTEL